MDFRTITRVVTENARLLVIGGSVAIVLALLAYGTPGLDGRVPTIKQRGSETWRSSTTLFITQQGFPWGRAVATYRPSNPGAGIPAVPVGDQDRLSTLAALYAELAESDVVRQIAARKGRLRAEIVAEPVTYQTAQFAYPQVLPLVRLTAVAPTSEGARAATQRVSDAFRRYVSSRQAAAKIPKSDRVVVDVAVRPDKPVLVTGRSTRLSIVVFVAILVALLAIAFVRDNIRRMARIEQDVYEARLEAVDPDLPAVAPSGESERDVPLDVRRRRSGS